MGNETRHFFGAFADVVVKPIPLDYPIRQCANGHETSSPYPFCPKCGQPVQDQTITKPMFETDLYRLLGEADIDTLSVITPAYLYGAGHIVLRSNRRDATVWMDIDSGTGGEHIRRFPSDAEQQAMIDALMTLPAIKELARSPLVISITPGTGYVEDADY